MRKRSCVGLGWSVVFGVWGAATTLGCGGRTSGTEDHSAGGGEVLETTDIGEVTSSDDTSGLTNGPGRPTTPLPPTAPLPAPTRPGVGASEPVTSGPTPSTTPPVPTTPITTTSGAPSLTSTAPSTETSTHSTSPTTGPTGPTGPADPTTEPPNSTDVGPTGPTSAPTSDVETVAPPPPDMFDLPEGEAPFGLPSDYASIDWLDSHSERCEMDWRYADEYSCYETTYCDGDWANTTNCWRDALTATWSCSCSQSSVNLPAAAVADTPGEACRAATSLCHANLSNMGQATCADYGEDAPEQCSQRRDCSSEHMSSHGPIQKQETSRWVNCSASDSPASACYCYLGDYSYAARLDVDLPAQESCDVAMDACAGNVDEGTEASPECVYASGSFSPQSCRRSYSCSQSALSGGVSVSRVFQQSASCDALAEPGTWNCSCLDEREPIEVVAAEAEDACDAMVLQCVSGLSAAPEMTASP